MWFTYTQKILSLHKVDVTRCFRPWVSMSVVVNLSCSVSELPIIFFVLEDKTDVSPLNMTYLSDFEIPVFKTAFKSTKNIYSKKYSNIHFKCLPMYSSAQHYYFHNFTKLY